MPPIAKMLDSPEYLHVTLNHIPLIGLAVAVLGLFIGLMAKSRAGILLGLFLVGFCSLGAWVVFYFGEQGYDRVLSMADKDGVLYLEHHKEMAERGIWVYSVGGVVAWLGLIFGWRRAGGLKLFSWVALLFALGSLAMGILIAEPGGAVRHREFRFAPPPKPQEGNKERHIAE